MPLLGVWHMQGGNVLNITMLTVAGMLEIE